MYILRDNRIATESGRYNITMAAVYACTRI